MHASAQLWLLSIPLLLCWSDAVHEGSNWRLLSSHLTLPCRCWTTCLEVKQAIFYLDGCTVSLSVPQPYFKTHKGCPDYSFRSSLATFPKTTIPSFTMHSRGQAGISPPAPFTLGQCRSAQDCICIKHQGWKTAIQTSLLIIAETVCRQSHE